MSPLMLFRRLAVTEAVTWALLLIGMVLKYVTKTTALGVSIFGMVHGVVFIAYCLTTIFVAINGRWSAKHTLLGLFSAIPPFMTVWFDRWAEKRNLLATQWRLRRGGETPTSAPEKAQAWMLANPVISVVIFAAAVAVLTGIALFIGPPASS